MCLSIHLADNFLVHPKKMQDGMDAGALRTELERLTGARRQNETELGIITAKKAKQMVIILATDKKKKKDFCKYKQDWKNPSQREHI